jgi:hypothetical protein
MTSQPHHGAKIGTRVAMVVSRATIATHKSLLSTKHKLAMAIFHSISNEISGETKLLLTPMLERMLESPDLHDDMRPFIEFLAHDTGQLSAIAGSAAGASGILSSVALIANNYLAPFVRDAIRGQPSQVPDPATIANIWAKGIGDTGDLSRSITGQGLNAGWQNWMVEAARQYPDTGTALDLFRRQLITNDEFKLILTRSGIPAWITDALVSAREIPLPPADAALAVLRGNLSESAGRGKAAESGVSAEDFTTLTENTGEPPATMQLLEAYRRGIINRAKLEHGIRQSRVRDEWIPTITELRFAPISIADAVNAFVQNHISHDEMARIAEDNGLEPGQVDILAETEGEPLSRGEATELLNRGQITRAQFEQDLRESRLKDKYIPHALELTRRLPEPRMLSAAVETGAVTHAYAVQIAMMYGYDKADAEMLANHGALAKLKTYRDRVVSGVEQLVEDNAIPEHTAKDMIHSLGYEDSEVTFILEAAKFRQNARLINSAVSALRSKLIAHHITSQEASAYLDALGIPAGQRDYLMKLWLVDLAANTTQLTEAQIIKSMKKGTITPENALERLQAKGYSKGDATILIEDT